MARDMERKQLWGVWDAMIRRCEGRVSPAVAKNYRGRGIWVCQRWRDSFSVFLADMGPRPPGHEIDRIDNDGNYEPGNCRWATPSQNRSNTRRNHLIDINGRRNTITGWSNETGVQVQTIRDRLRRGVEPTSLVALKDPAMERGQALVSAWGRSQTLAAWCKELGLRRRAVYLRLDRGWEPERAFARPVRFRAAKNSNRGAVA